MTAAPSTSFIHPDLRITEHDIKVALSASDDPRTQVAAFIVSPIEGWIISRGTNGFSHYLLSRDERAEAPGKYSWFLHAEARAICNAAKRGVRLEDTRIYVTMPPCLSCANLIISAGIDTVYVPRDKQVPVHWDATCLEASQAFDEAGINYVVF